MKINGKREMSADSQPSNSEKDYLSTISDETRQLRDISYYLGQLGKALDMTGNSHLATELTDAARDIFNSSESISNAVGKEINDQCNESQRQLGETFSLVLGSILAK